jgi:hypothetical protein
LYDGDDYYYAFGSNEEALEFSEGNAGAEEPLALVLQEEYIDEPHPGNYIYVKGRRLTEWPVEFLHRPRRNENTIPDFFSLTAPENRGGHHKRACLRISWLTSTVPSNFPGRFDICSGRTTSPPNSLALSGLWFDHIFTLHLMHCIPGQTGSIPVRDVAKFARTSNYLVQKTVVLCS